MPGLVAAISVGLFLPADKHILGSHYRERLIFPLATHPRIGLFINPQLDQAYLALTAAARDYRFDRVYAAPDAPELAFVLGKPGAQRAMVDLFSPGYEDQQRFEVERFKRWTADPTALIVLKSRPAFSRPLSLDFVRAVEGHYGPGAHSWVAQMFLVMGDRRPAPPKP